jgi:hypothetical protein
LCRPLGPRVYPIYVFLHLLGIVGDFEAAIFPRTEVFIGTLIQRNVTDSNWHAVCMTADSSASRHIWICTYIRCSQTFCAWYPWWSQRKVWYTMQKKLGKYTTYICIAHRKESTKVSLLILILNVESMWTNFRLQEAEERSHLSRYISFAESLQSQLILKWFVTKDCWKLALINAVSMYMNENFWYPWKASLVPQEVPTPEFEDRWLRSFTHLGNRKGTLRTHKIINEWISLYLC